MANLTLKDDVFEAALLCGFDGASRCDAQKKVLSKMARVLNERGRSRFCENQHNSRGKRRPYNCRDVATAISYYRHPEGWKMPLSMSAIFHS